MWRRFCPLQPPQKWVLAELESGGVERWGSR